MFPHNLAVDDRVFGDEDWCPEELVQVEDVHLLRLISECVQSHTVLLVRHATHQQRAELFLVLRSQSQSTLNIFPRWFISIVGKSSLKVRYELNVFLIALAMLSF